MKTTFLLLTLTVGISFCASGQHSLTGRVFDGQTKEPLAGAHITVPATPVGTTSDVEGRFTLSSPDTIDFIEVSFIGYEKKAIVVGPGALSVGLMPSVSNLQQVVVTANREASLRTECPIAISKLSPVAIHDTKPVLIAELMNKVPGVVMLNYNNEQHAMAIRQPMGTSPYYLYMEDGIPIRPMGIFNHNALIEMNVFGLSAIEVIKGPASSLYGPEAVGGAVNFITHRPTAIPEVKVGVQADQWGYRRLQYGGGGMLTKKLGLYVSGFEARQKNSWQAFSDYNKSSVNARVDYRLTDATRVTLAFSGNEYYSDMAGSVDSVAFYNRQYTSTTDFTYRKVHSQRTRLTVSHQWSEGSETELTLGYRDNYIEQNPNYAIRRMPGSATASGEVNRNTFYSRLAILQHNVRFHFLDAALLAGASIDYSPNSYWAYRTDLGARLRPDGSSVEKYVFLRERPDLYLSDYSAHLKNSAVYSQFEINPLPRLKVTAGLRYDNMAFDYSNHLDRVSGRKAYARITPKVGATFDLLHDHGLYLNYSQGFSPPGLTAIFRERPGDDANSGPFYYDLEPARFDNIEVGGWGAFFENKVYIDVAAYQMIGRHELLNIRQEDNSYDYQSAGKTIHRGIEYSATYKPDAEWFIRFGGTNALHRFEEFQLSEGTDEAGNVNGNDMPQAPRWIANSEVTYKPHYAKGLRLSVEWQRIGSWYEDQVNQVKYDERGFLGFKGVSYLNFRMGYKWKGMEVFTNVMNMANELYANSATRGNGPEARTTFTPAAPRTFVAGIQYNFEYRK